MRRRVAPVGHGQPLQPGVAAVAGIGIQVRLVAAEHVPELAVPVLARLDAETVVRSVELADGVEHDAPLGLGLAEHPRGHLVDPELAQVALQDGVGLHHAPVLVHVHLRHVEVVHDRGVDLRAVRRHVVEGDAHVGEEAGARVDRVHVDGPAPAVGREGRGVQAQAVDPVIGHEREVEVHDLALGELEQVDRLLDLVALLGEQLVLGQLVPLVLEDRGVASDLIGLETDPDLLRDGQVLVLGPFAAQHLVPDVDPQEGLHLDRPPAVEGDELAVVGLQQLVGLHEREGEGPPDQHLGLAAEAVVVEGAEAGDGPDGVDGDGLDAVLRHVHQGIRVLLVLGADGDVPIPGVVAVRETGVGVDATNDGLLDELFHERALPFCDLAPTWWSILSPAKPLAEGKIESLARTHFPFGQEGLINFVCKELFCLKKQIFKPATLA